MFALDQSLAAAWRLVTVVLNVVVGHPQLPTGVPIVALGFDILEAVRNESRYDDWRQHDPRARGLLTVMIAPSTALSWARHAA